MRTTCACTSAFLKREISLLWVLKIPFQRAVPLPRARLRAGSLPALGSACSCQVEMGRQSLPAFGKQTS